MSSIYNVSYPQTVETTLVTGRHPETQSHVIDEPTSGGSARVSARVSDLLVSNVHIWPDFINMSSGSSVSQQEILQLRDRRRLIWRILE